MIRLDQRVEGVRTSGHLLVCAIIQSGQARDIWWTGYNSRELKSDATQTGQNLVFCRDLTHWVRIEPRVVVV